MVYFPHSLWQFAISTDYFVKTSELRALTIISSAFDGLWLEEQVLEMKFLTYFREEVMVKQPLLIYGRDRVNVNK